MLNERVEHDLRPTNSPKSIEIEKLDDFCNKKKPKFTNFKVFIKNCKCKFSLIILGYSMLLLFTQTHT